MKTETKGHGSYPWWAYPVMIIAAPVIMIRALVDYFRGARDDKKGQDPHDISGEPDIPGGGRP